EADGINDLAWLTRAGWALRIPSQFRGRAASRPLLEWSVRRRLAQNPRVSFVDGQSAQGLVAGETRERVVGVRIRPRSPGADGSVGEQTLNADLIVDATGRGSRATRWLQDLGYAEPARTEINAYLGYTSRLYRLPDDSSRDWQGLYVQASLPRDLRGGVLYRLE